MATDLPLVIGVGPAADPRPALQLRVPPELFMEIAHELRSEEVLLGTPITASASASDLTVLVASIGGGLGGVAAVITAVASRHRHRSVRLMSRDGGAVELTGISSEEMDKRTAQFLAAEQKKHEEVRHLYDFPTPKDDDSTLR